MLTAPELVELYDLASLHPAAFEKWKAVKMQAIRHTRAEKPDNLLDRQRPNEAKEILEYRLANYRAITNEGIVKFNDKVARIVNNSGWSISVASDRLRDWMNGSFITENGDSLSFQEYISRLVVPSSFEDPNGILVAFPYNANNPTVSPSNSIEDGGLSANESVTVEPLIVGSTDLVYLDRDIFAWQSGMWQFKSEGKDVYKPYFFICDRFAFYRYVPVAYDNTNGGRKVKYELELWYVHDTGQGEVNELPLNILGGTITKACENDKVVYNQSFLQPYFELGDECIVTFSDYQAVRVRTAYPVRAIVEQQCNTCNGEGKVKVKTANGDSLQTCGTCSGSGMAKDLSPFTDIVVKEGEARTRPPLEYITPPTEILNFLNDAWQSLLNKAKMSINLDLITDVQESGEAKKVRLQDLHDMLIKIASNTFEVTERLLWFTECLLQPIRSQRVVPIIQRPVSFEIKTEEMLSEELKTVHPAEVYSTLMSYYKKKYAGSEDVIRTKELALMYAPLLAVTSPQELQIRLLGAYGNNDLVKRDRAEWAIQQIIKEGKINIFTAPVDVIFKELDRLISPFLQGEAVPIFN